MRKLRVPEWSVPLALLVSAILAYGLLANRLGYYWDDWGFAWISRTFGPSGLERYFSTNRPVWGRIYALTTPILGANPFVWHIFALIWRWLSAVAIWLLLRMIWPDKKAASTWAAFFALLYPGFGQQSIGLMYSHFFIVMTALFVSLGLMVWSIRSFQEKEKPAWQAYLASAAALLLGALNLFSMEYFFGLDLLRPLLIWIVLGGSIPRLRQRAEKCLLYWVPYLAVTLIYLFWRVVIFKFPTYQPQLSSGPSAGLMGSLGALVQPIPGDLARVTVGAWGRVFQPPLLTDFGARSTLVYWGLAAGCILLATVYFYFLADKSGTAPTRRPAFEMIVVGMTALLLGGWPFWITRLPIGLSFPNDRFTLPFLFGCALVLAGLIDLIPRFNLPKIVLAGIFIGLAVGVQFQNATAYRRDWNIQRSFFWQLAWRAPAITPGTAILSEQTPLPYESDNTLTAPVNWMYAPDNRGDRMSYIFYFPSVRLSRGLPSLEEGKVIHQNYLAAGFDGSTSQVLVVYFNPPACLRVLDPRRDVGFPMLPGSLVDALALSKPDLIEVNPATPMKPLAFLGSEPAHAWCYYYEKADLAIQAGDWARAASLGDQAFQLNDYPNEASERIIFIEAYAHTGEWDKARSLTLQAYQITNMMQPMLCATWQRIGHIPGLDAQGETVFKEVRQTLACQ